MNKIIDKNEKKLTNNVKRINIMNKKEKINKKEIFL